MGRVPEVQEYEYAEMKAETDRAWLLTVENEDIWFPKSQCEVDTKRKTIDVPNWIARQKGLI